MTTLPSKYLHKTVPSRERGTERAETQTNPPVSEPGDLLGWLVVTHRRPSPGPAVTAEPLGTSPK